MNAESVLREYEASVVRLMEALKTVSNAAPPAPSAGADDSFPDTLKGLRDEDVALPASVRRAVESVVHSDANFKQALEELKEQVALKQRIAQTRNKCDANDRQVAQMVAQLEDVALGLETAVRSGREQLEKARTADKARILPSTLTHYAEFTSNTSAAPFGWQAGLPLGSTSMPYPTELLIRGGRLYSDAARRAAAAAEPAAVALEGSGETDVAEVDVAEYEEEADEKAEEDTRVRERATKGGASQATLLVRPKTLPSLPPSFQAATPVATRINLSLVDSDSDDD